MPQSRKETAWKKSRKFGDVKGGRMRPKLADNIFNRQHNLLPPGPNESTPIYIKDNPSRDYFFPVSIDEIKLVIEKLPEEHVKNLTHIWLRKISTKKFNSKDAFQGCFICGSGINLIVLYPFPKSLKMYYGKRKPSSKKLNWYAAYQPELKEGKQGWYLLWTKDKIKKYYLEGLLLHEIGHKVDSQYQRYWSKAYYAKGENFANNYAFYWGNEIRNEFD